MSLKVADTQKGRIAGVLMEGFTVFKGIPYAKPPVGELRFQAPREAEAWEGVKNADTFSSIAFQMGQEEGSFYHKEFYTEPAYLSPMSEDCLYLNIWTPASDNTEKLPVAFWIHGGAFLNGYGHEIEFDGESYCKKGVILVTINYRLGAFGFLAHKWLRAENGQNGYGNYGILDQIAALDWVYSNIAAFGGNPLNITVMGQSAGCMSVQTLVSSPLTKGKIAKAILQSAGGYRSGINRDRTLEEAEAFGEEFVQACQAATLEELRALPAETIMEKVGEVFRNAMKKGVTGLPFTPVIDNYVLLEGYDAAAEKGRHQDIPYMIGSTKNDIGSSPETVSGEVKSQLYKGCIGWSHISERLGRKPAYVYYFTRDLLGDEAGAFHSSELWYMFGTLGRSWRPKEDADYRLAERMVSYWTNFMKNGDTNGEGLPHWEACTEEGVFVMELKG